jgi:exopolysaccharide biosynthesis operon protein EpsL
MRESADVGVKSARGPQPKRTGFLLRGLVLGCLALFGVAINARADEGDGFQVQTKVNMTHDDNLFLLPDPSVIPPGASHTGSTWMQTETADLSFDRIYGLQAVHLDVNANHYSFDSLHYLDFNAVNYNAQWNWQLGTRLSGTLSADREKTLASYDNFHYYGTPNLNIHTGETFTFDWDAAGPWHVVGGVIHANISSPSQFTQVGTFSQTDFQWGARYLTAAGNSVTFQVRNSIGSFSRDVDAADVLDNGYTQREAEMLSHWNVGAWTSVDTRIGYVDRSYDHFSARDYQGWVGQVAVNWQTSARTSFNVVASRNVVSFQSDNTSFFWLEQLSVGPTWNVTSKLKLQATGNVSWRTFEGGLPGSAPLDPRSDRLYGGRIELDYQPTRHTAVSVFAALSQQNGNAVETAYKDRQVGITASYTF